MTIDKRRRWVIQALTRLHSHANVVLERSGRQLASKTTGKRNTEFGNNRFRAARNTMLAFIILLLLAGAGSAATLTVDAQANIFGAGHSSPPGGGLLPAVFGFPAGTGQVLLITNVQGTVSSGANITGADGAHGGPSTDMNSIGGISGIVDDESGFFLVGMFTTDAEPAAAAPGRLDFSSESITENFGALLPRLNQTFFVGDGRKGIGTGTGTVQRLYVPPGATRFFLGFADGNSAGTNSDEFNYHGDPGYYSDNTGSLQVQFKIVREVNPSAGTLTVEARANIFGAGHSSPPGGGVLPPVFHFHAGTGMVLVVSTASGTVSSGANTTGPDGAHGGPSTDMNST